MKDSTWNMMLLVIAVLNIALGFTMTMGNEVGIFNFVMGMLCLGKWFVNRYGYDVHIQRRR